MALALLKYQFFLKNQYWVASGILFGIAAAIWAGPETKAGFIVIIVVFVLVSVVVRGLVQGLISMLQMKGQEKNEGDENEASDGAATSSAEPDAEGEKGRT